jgi:hypothetical protein
MDRIIVAGDTPEQYIEQVSSSPDSFRPANCPGCSKEGLWHHGSYPRYPDRATADHKALNPVPILRFQMSSLRQDMLMPSNVPGAQALAFMVDTANHSIAHFVRKAHQPYQQRASTIKAYDCPLESVATTDA